MAVKTSPRIAVVIPCFKVADHVIAVISGIPAFVERIYCVDDACPAGSGDIVERQCKDARVHLLRHDVNQGVGGAVLTGYAAALTDGFDIVVKVDGDGQMPLERLPELLRPILAGKADYTKGNRFYFLSDVKGMPAVRTFGNGVLSLLTKFSSGYWSIFDPTNGFTAIHRGALARLRPEKIARRYFFESDMLHHLYLERAVVLDVPTAARYGDEGSSLRIASIVGPFAYCNLRNFLRRVIYTYFVRDLNVASLEMCVGLPLILSGATWSMVHLIRSVTTGIPATAGESLIGVLPLILGFQMLLAALQFDTQNEPRQPLQADGSDDLAVSCAIAGKRAV